MEGIWKSIVGWACYAGALAVTFMAYDRVVNYTKGYGSLIEARHAHVGGDAYNYIINGTHATALMLAALALAVVGTYALLSRRLDELVEASAQRE